MPKQMSSAVSKMPSPPMKKTRAPAVRARKTTSASMAPAPIAPAVEPTHAEIAARAFQIFEARGAARGSAVTDWLMAESELRAKLQVAVT
jgi:hypothetical protein